MKTLTQKTIVAFHTGRGGRFYNAGHKTFLGQKDIQDFTDNLFVNFENKDEILKVIGERPNLLEKFEECMDNRDFSFFKKLGLDAGELIYTDCNGCAVGLSVEEAETGIGCINIDNDYDTTYTTYVEDLTEEEINIIIKSDVFDKKDFLNEYAKFVGFEDYEIQLMDYFNDYEDTLINACPQFKSNGERTGYNYGLEEFDVHNSDEDLNEDFLEIDNKFYTKN